MVKRSLAVVAGFAIAVCCGLAVFSGTAQAQSSGDGYEVVDPTRLLDSRPGFDPVTEPVVNRGIGTWGPGQTQQVTVAGVGGVPAEATAVAVHVTSVNPSALSYLTAWAAGRPQPEAAAKNYGPTALGPLGHAGLTNDVLLVPVGSNGQISLFNAAGTVDLVVDLVGYYISTDPASPQPHSITGMVVDEADGLPLAAIEVCAVPVEEFEFGGRQVDAYWSEQVCVLTTASGEYVIAGLEERLYGVQFTDPAGVFIPETAPMFGSLVGIDFNFPALLVTPDEQAPVGIVPVSLMRGATISGTVTDPDGAGLAGAAVCVDHFDDASFESVWFGCTESGPDGSYSFGAFLSGELSVWAQPPVDSTHLGASRTVIAEPLEMLTEVDIQLRAGSTVSGLVSNGAGALLEGIRVCAGYPTGFNDPSNFGRFSPWCASTDSEGHYQLVGLDLSGVDTIQFFDPQGEYRWVYLGDTRDEFNAVRLSYPPGSNVDASAVLEAAASISGRVSNAATGIGDVVVCVDVTSPGFFGIETHCSSSEDDGTYRVGGLGPGEAALTFWDTGGVYASGRLNRTLAPAEQVTGADVVLYVGGSITGVVTDALGAPVSQVLVCANFDACANTGSDGTYRIDGVAPGPAWVSAVDRNYPETWYGDAIRGRDAALFEVVAAQVESGIDIQLATYGTIEGVVTDAAGNPLADIDVCISVACDMTDSTGSYSLDGVFGDHVVSFEDYSGKYELQYFDGVASSALATIVSVGSGETVTGVDASLSPTPTISGSVSGPAAEPLAGIEICATPDRDFGWADERCTYSEADGSYLVFGLTIEPHTVRFQDPNGIWNVEFYDGASVEADATRVTPDSAGSDAVDVQMDSA